MKWIIFTLVLLFASYLLSQEAVHPTKPQDVQQVSEEQNPVPIPNVENAILNDPAVTETVTVDSVTLPGYIGTLRRDDSAYSIAQFGAGNGAGSPATSLKSADDSAPEFVP